MKTVFILVGMATVSLVSANQYYGNGQGYCPSCDNGSGYYQNQPNNGNYYQSERNYQGQNPQGYYQQGQNPQGYYQQGQNPQGYYQQGQNPRGYDQRGEQNYQRNDQYQSQNNDEQKSSDYTESQLQTSEKKYSQDFASNPRDRQINAKIRDKLGGGMFSKGYESLIIKTTNGVVIVSGSVDKPADVQKVVDQIKDIEGVNSVVNQLTVKSQ